MYLNRMDRIISKSTKEERTLLIRVYYTYWQYCALAGAVAARFDLYFHDGQLMASPTETSVNKIRSSCTKFGLFRRVYFNTNLTFPCQMRHRVESVAENSATINCSATFNAVVQLSSEYTWSRKKWQHNQQTDWRSGRLYQQRSRRSYKFRSRSHGNLLLSTLLH